MSLFRKSSEPVLVPPPAQPATPSASAVRPLVVVIDDDVAVDESFGHMRAAGYDT